MSTSRQLWWCLAKADGPNQCFQWSLRWKISSSWHYPKYLPSFAHPSSCMVCCMGLQPLTCWDCGFESHQGHGYLSLVSVVCCHVEISVRGQSLVQRSHTKCGVSECDLKISTMRRPGPTTAVEPWKKPPPFMKLTAPYKFCIHDYDSTTTQHASTKSRHHYHHIIIIKSFYSLWSIGHPWRASRLCDLQLSPWPCSMIFSPVLLISSSVVLRHVLFGLLILLYPWGFQSNAVFSIVPASLHNVCPIQFHVLLFIYFLLASVEWFSIVVSL
jgi:hypothetical protein